jgi:hypothetical protein
LKFKTNHTLRIVSATSIHKLITKYSWTKQLTCCNHFTLQWCHLQSHQASYGHFQTLNQWACHENYDLTTVLSHHRTMTTVLSHHTHWHHFLLPNIYNLIIIVCCKSFPR